MQTAVLRSSAMRTSISLDGSWDFCHEIDNRWRVAHVPLPWQAEFSDLRQLSGKARYVRRFARPSLNANQQCVLKFGAVGYFCEVFLNEILIGSHEGGYLPFEFVLERNSLQNDNHLEVRVILPTGNEKDYPEFPFAEIPHGKQSWYGPIGGIWQSVSLELRDKRHLGHCLISPDPAEKSVRFRLEFSPDSIGNSATVTITGPEGGVVFETGFLIDTRFVDQKTRLDAVSLWSPVTPNLYVAKIDINADGAVVESTAHTFGFRSFETRDGKFYLNGSPFHVRGALDQDYYPDGICTPPSVEFLEDQIRKAKQLGLNMLRCHIKIPDPRYYEAADRLGMLIWTEIPNVATFTVKSAQRMRETMEGILRRDHNHPCIVIWTLINEDWGTRLIEDASHRAWLRDTYDWLKALDPTRLVVDNSACHSNFHIKTDINDYHYYRSVPERREEWEALTDEFANGAAWTYSPHGDAVRRGDEPLVVSEFGVWGLPDVTKAVGADGKQPWWMETGPAWGDGAAYPHGIETRFTTYQLGSVFGSFSNFIEQVQWYQFGNLKYEIESLRARSAIQGYVITELTDVHWEANGLLDMNRNPRVFHDRFAAINTDLVIVPVIEHYCASAGKTFRFKVMVATGGKRCPQGAILVWSLGAIVSADIRLAAVESLESVAVADITVDIPDDHAGGIEHLRFSLQDGESELAQNSVAISIYPTRDTSILPAISSDDPALLAFAEGLGYRVGKAGEQIIRFVNGLGREHITDLQSGARYVVLADGKVKTHGNLRTDAPSREQPFIPIVDGVPGNLPNADSQLPNINLLARHGTMWRGDWIASFSWIRRSGAFASIPGGPLLDLSFDRVAPRHVMTGFRPWEFDGLVHSGLVVGWAHKPAVLIGERRIGKGLMVATTFRLTHDAPGVDPVAAALFDALVKTAAGSKSPD
jgi:Glycosyl hydrolases family 2, TIM barrel domain/Glycosyl hydrolases family 2/Glycosyl hydrolases family 2, sugar binding domain